MNAWMAKAIRTRLTHLQMSIPVRMMAIADVFEALTAADRPYKPASCYLRHSIFWSAWRMNIIWTAN
ncbi:Uncharacterised protein [Serratia fonticola]|uniref:Uncharacterized protein n=1 Tax=Serratia fonticola TaxID=47917 RepID=A0A4U9W489_SERFO|nr:Uncharacterised protein [Serratia fonticola]